MNFIAIDIGSNAVRLLFSNVFENSTVNNFKKASLIRVPLRLGVDSFLHHRISDEKAAALIKTMKAFKYLIEAMQPADYMACATSAMREADNGSEIVKIIKRQTGIPVNIIDGKREAEIICSNQIAEILEPDRSYLYIDVGGGSSELTLFADKKILFSESFKIGTIRILKKVDSQSEWARLKSWLKKMYADHHPISGIGSGGNINTVFKIAGRKTGKPFTYNRILKIYKFLNSYTYEERVKKLGLKTDRADVIIPALDIFLYVMKWGKLKNIHIPVIGLLDGIIHVLFNKHKCQGS